MYLISASFDLYTKVERVYFVSKLESFYKLRRKVVNRFTSNSENINIIYVDRDDNK